MFFNVIGFIVVFEVFILGFSEFKYLKCSMCFFVVKWSVEFQKYVVFYFEERSFVCMVCGFIYKWKWDLVKYFEKSYNFLINLYKRRE